jgi:hypothetical protein
MKSRLIEALLSRFVRGGLWKFDEKWRISSLEGFKFRRKVGGNPRKFGLRRIL